MTTSATPASSRPGHHALPPVGSTASPRPAVMPWPAATARSDTRAFLIAAAGRPARVGAVAPSSRALAAVVAATVPTISEPTVVELGPGTGVISDAIARRLRPAGGRQLAVELHPDLAAHLRHTRPWLQVLAGDAAQLTHLLSGCGVDQADAVVSALPWTLMSAATQQRILEQIHAVLVPGGGFTTIITLSAWPFPACRRFRHLVEQTFGSCVILGPIWHNLPPALVLTCTKAHHA